MCVLSVALPRMHAGIYVDMTGIKGASREENKKKLVDPGAFGELDLDVSVEFTGAATREEGVEALCVM